LKSRLYFYFLKIRIGDPFKSRLRITIDEFPEIFKTKKLGCLFG